MKFKFILYLLIPFTLSCNKTKDFDTDAQKITGIWIWTKSYGGFAGITYTPESTGEIRKLSFSSSRIYKEYYNDSLVYVSTYKVSETYMDFTKKISPVILFNGNPVRLYSFTDNNPLVLIYLAADGFTHSYKRIK